MFFPLCERRSHKPTYNLPYNLLCEIWGYHSGSTEDWFLLLLLFLFSSFFFFLLLLLLLLLLILLLLLLLLLLLHLLLLLLLLPLILILILRWNYSPMRTFPSLTDFSQSAPFFGLPFQFLILHLLICVCIQFHHLYFGHLSRLPCRLLSNTWLRFLLLSILLKWPIQFNPLIRTNEK